MKRESIYLVHFEGAKELNKKEWDKFRLLLLKIEVDFSVTRGYRYKK